MEDQMHCGICDVKIDKAVNWKYYQYHTDDEAWCDDCTERQEVYYESMRE